MSGVTYELDLATGHLSWSPELQTAFGYEPGAAATIEWWTDHIHHDDAMILNQAMDKLNDSYSKDWTVEYRLQKADNTYVLVQDHAELIRDDMGLPLRLKGTLTPKA